MGEHRVSVLNASLRRYEDPERSADPRLRQLVADLRALDPAPAPRAHFRAELRAQLVAVAPRLVAEGVSVETPHAERKHADARHSPVAPASSRRRSVGDRLTAASARLRTLSLGRPLAIVTAVVAIFAMLLGSAVWVSKKALPGDALYSLKRANEKVRLSLITDDTAKGKQYLSLAGTRVDEVSQLLSRASALPAAFGPSAARGVNGHTAKLITDTLASGDSDVRDGAQLLGTEAVDSRSATPLSAIANWAPGQIGKLQSIADRLPAGDVKDRATASAQLVRNALTRANTLDAMLGCTCLNNAPTDDLGPVPCPVCMTPVPLPQPGGGTGTVPGVPPSIGGTGGAASNSGGVNASATGSGAESGGTSSGGSLPGLPGTSGQATLPTLPLPPLTITLPTLLPTKSASPGVSQVPTCALSLLGICIKG